MKKFFNIFGVKTPIRTFKETEDTAHLMGFATKTPLQIYIGDSVPKDLYDECLLHEALHCVFYRVGLDQVLSKEVNEILCETVSKFVTENYKLKGK